MPYIPPVNETTSPYNFDSQVNIAGADATGGLSGLQPADVSLKAWTFPTYLASGSASAVTVTGSVYLAAVHLRLNQTYSNVYFKLQANGGTAGTTSAGPANSFAGIYNNLGSLVATTGTIDAILGTGAGTSGAITTALSTAYTAQYSGLHYVALQFAASPAGSFPALNTYAGFTTVTTSAGTIALPGVTAAPYPYSAVATTSGTALPATFTLGSAGTTGAFAYWAGLA